MTRLIYGCDYKPLAAWTPRTDVVESDKGFRLELDLPGIKREQLDIQVAADRVTVKGERKRDAEAEAYHRAERPYGTFVREFYLPEQVNQAAIEAKLNDGVLSLFLPKREETKPRQIAVEAA